MAQIGDGTDYASTQAALFATAFAQAGGTIVGRDAKPDAMHVVSAPLGWWKAFKGARPRGAPDSADLLLDVRISDWRGSVLPAASVRIDADTLPRAGDAAEGTICVSEAHAPAMAPFTRYATYAADGVSLLADLIAEGADTRDKRAAAIASQRRTGRTGSLAFAPDGWREHVDLPVFEAQSGAWRALP